jgi:hypothetical protein
VRRGERKKGRKAKNGETRWFGVRVKKWPSKLSII